MLIKYPDFLYKDNINININNHTIKVERGGYVGEDGISAQALYSYLKEEWKTHHKLIKYEFPLIAIDKDMFIKTGLWHITPNNIKSGMIFPNESTFQDFKTGQYEKFKKDLIKDIRMKKLNGMKKSGM